MLDPTTSRRPGLNTFRARKLQTLVSYAVNFVLFGSTYTRDAQLSTCFGSVLACITNIAAPAVTEALLYIVRYP